MYLKNFKKKIKKEIDSLYVHTDQPIVDGIFTIVRKNRKVNKCSRDE